MRFSSLLASLVTVALAPLVPTNAPDHGSNAGAHPTLAIPLPPPRPHIFHQNGKTYVHDDLSTCCGIREEMQTAGRKN
jgi:hypothetical protein